MRVLGRDSYPKQVVIGDEIWFIEFKKRMSDHGLCDPSTKTIYIKAGMSHAETLSTYIHELIHAFEFVENYNLKVSHKQVYTMERAIIDFLLANL